MFSKVLEFIAFLSLLQSVTSDNSVQKRFKRADIDLQTCIDNFNIHRDKIIRTQDSQKMGAKYLNEIDLGSREECLRLCCETENCDVFVYEEKNSGSCYLFHCGPPEDFKCKFTHHVNYSSAVLAVSRHLPDLESQIKLTKHEQDLTKLRKPEVEPEIIRPVVPEIRTTPSTTTTTVITKEVLPNTSKIKTADEPRKCSRFQFECRSSGECIAIYNACDGIPQCADASDEAPELGCPGTTTPLPPAAFHPNNVPLPVRYDSNVPHLPQLTQPVNNPALYRPQVSHDTINQQIPPAVSHPEPDFIRPISDPRISSRIPYDPQQIQPYVPQVPVQNAQNWLPHPQNQIIPQMPQYNDKNSHIFNHKENGLQVPDGQEISQMQYVDGREYPKVSNYYQDNYRQPVQQDNWSPGDGSYNANSNQYQQENVQDERRSEQVNYKSPPSIQPANEKLDTVNPKHEQDKMAHELKHSKQNMDHGTPIETAKIKIPITSQQEPETHHEQYPDVMAYKMSDADDLHDGFAKTPKGALLSLTIGVIVTCLMAILIGCRLRVVRRRMRRSGKSYAHDADYLVNGMYL